MIAVTGDVGNQDLGLSADDKLMLLNEVTIVFHVAATLKLDANLKDAVNMNTEGTLRLLHMSCEMKNLVVGDASDEYIGIPINLPRVIYLYYHLSTGVCAYFNGLLSLRCANNGGTNIQTSGRSSKCYKFGPLDGPRSTSSNHR